MDEKDFIRKQIFEEWNPVAELAGEKVLHKLVENKLSGHSSSDTITTIEDEGTPFDLELALTIASTAVSIIKIIIDVIKLFDQIKAPRSEIISRIEQNLQSNINKDELDDALNNKNLEKLIAKIEAEYQNDRVTK